MAVRNLDAIVRHGDMVAEQKANAKKLRDDYFWKRIGLIRDTREDAIDMVDTLGEIGRHGLWSKFEKWDKRDQAGASIHMSCMSPRRFMAEIGGCCIYYNPYDDVVEFYWSGYGMCEKYSTTSDNEDYLISHVTSDKRTYDTLLTAMATNIRPYIDNFFKWLETL